MSKIKYSIFHVQGGFGKHIAATAVAKCIKNNHPSRQLIVVGVWTEIFQNLPFIDRVYNWVTPVIFIKLILKIRTH